MAAAALGLEAEREARAEGRGRRWGREEAAAGRFMRPLSIRMGKAHAWQSLAGYISTRGWVGTTRRLCHQPTVTDHVPGSWGSTVTTMAELGMLSSSFSP